LPENLPNWIEENLLIQNYKKKSLDGYKEVLHSLNLKKPKEIILVGGTNGKGSLSELITKLALRKNISVGTFTSPHLLNFNERIRVNAKEISDEKLLDVLKKFNRYKESHNLNFYQIISLAALNHFNKLDLDLWVLEIGMGGRLDPMNFIEPDISVITKVALDHQEYLGDTIEEIAAEKAEIARPEKPLIFGSDNVPNAIIEKATKISSFLISPNKKSYALNEFSKKRTISREVLFCLNEVSKNSIFDFSSEITEKFLNDFKIFGRLTLFDNFLVDSAHNEDSVRNLINYLDSNFKEKKINLFFACSENKDPVKLLEPFQGIVDKIYLADNIHQRLMSSKKVLSKTKTLNFDFVIKNSMKSLYSIAIDKNFNELNLFSGSFYFSGELFKYLLEVKNLPVSISSLGEVI
jgi:dihydrofolate synthase/folylpolyglutamate synthase